MVTASDPKTRQKLLEAWSRSSAETSAQSAKEEFLAEHILMAHVLSAMEREAQRLASGQPLRTTFWAGVVDFVGNFVHLCHRRKEEQVCYPSVTEAGAQAKLEGLRRDHAKAESMTMDLCEAIETGDWEQALRLVHIYLHAMRGHMESEEREIFDLLPELSAPQGTAGSAASAPGATHISPTELRQSLVAVEKVGLRGRSRAHYRELAQRLCEDAGVTPP